MSLFSFLAGMLTMLAVLMLLLPWLRTIPHFASLPALPWPVPLIGVAVVGGTLALYHWLGSPQSIAQPQSAGMTEQARATAAGAGARGTAAASMSASIDSLRARLAGGGSADDWELLAKSYEFMGQPEAARQARAHQLPLAEPATQSARAAVPAQVPLSPDSLNSLAKAQQLRHDKQYSAAAKIYQQLAAANQLDADGWADYADTAASLQGDKLAGEPEKYIANALALNADHAKALWLKASADEEAGRLSAAIPVWQHLQTLLLPDSQDATIVAANLERDRHAGGTTAGGVSVSGEVLLAPSLANKARPGATLFIVAKAVGLPGPPVAVYRGSVGSWPVKFRLDDSSAMLPGRNLTNAKRITVEARVSSSGQAQPAAGDLRGVSEAIDPSNHSPLTIIINEIVT